MSFIMPKIYCNFKNVNSHTTLITLIQPAYHFEIPYFGQCLLLQQCLLQSLHGQQRCPKKRNISLYDINTWPIVRPQSTQILHRSWSIHVRQACPELKNPSNYYYALSQSPKLATYIIVLYLYGTLKKGKASKLSDSQSVVQNNPCSSRCFKILPTSFDRNYYTQIITQRPRAFLSHFVSVDLKVRDAPTNNKITLILILILITIYD